MLQWLLLLTQMIHIHPFTKRDQIKAAYHIPDFQLWKSQVSDAFGFIPQNRLVGKKDFEANKYIECLLLAHEKVKASGKYNFQKTKIHIPSQFKMEKWKKSILSSIGTGSSCLFSNLVFHWILIRWMSVMLFAY